MTSGDRTDEVTYTVTSDGHYFYSAPRDAGVFREPVRADGTARLQADGEFDRESVACLERAITDTRGDGATRLLLDLSGVTFGDSSFLNVLLRTHNTGRLVLTGSLPRHLDQLFKLTGTDRVFHLLGP
ncbi:STAS domain-containing protein [Streptomyces showdoensis]|uniref:STAS domain-containing protein n=1 Tax=Streptomyces showdoensis TaxID=68268 RepID=UPI000F4DB3C5|nr:STAS domain-containing protein [Streptomyces showdoensis]